MFGLFLHYQYFREEANAMPNLMLSRRIGETIVLDEKITITITEVDGNHVRLSIQAPREVNIRRGELPAHVPVTTS